MEDTTVVVESMIKGTVSINLPEINLRSEWPTKGTKRMLSLEKLKQAMYEPGVENMFKQGILYIRDMNAKIELGLEYPGTTEPTNIKLLDDAMKKRMMGPMPMRDFKQKLTECSLEQIQDLVSYAIENEIADFNKAEVLKEYTQTDIINAIQLKRSIERD